MKVILAKSRQSTAKPSKVSLPYAYDPVKDGVSQSMLAEWLRCRESSRLGTLNGWTVDGIRKPLLYGDVAHFVVEQYTKGIKDESITKLDDAYSKLVGWVKAGEVEYWAQNKRTSDAEEIMEESCSIIMHLMPRYFKKWYIEDKATNWQHVEDKFSVPVEIGFGKVPIFVPMVGKFDATFLGGKGEPCLFETKNKSQITSGLLDMLPLDLQLGYYLSAMKELFKQTASKIKYNVIRRPGERRKVNESLSSYCMRIGENIAKDPDHYFLRVDIKLSPQEVAEHIRRAKYLVTEFYKWWQHSKGSESRDLMWNSGSCETKFGTCPMLPICVNGDYANHHKKLTPSPELA